MTERHPHVRDPHPGEVTAWHPAEKKVAAGSPTGAATGTCHPTGSRRPEGD